MKQVYVGTFEGGSKAVVEAPSKEIAEHVLKSNWPRLDLKKVVEGKRQET